MKHELLNHISQMAYSYRETVYNTYELALEVIERGIEGDFVESGVAAGSQIAAMQVAAMEKGVTKTIYAIDSFKGIPLAGEHDESQPGIGEIKHDRYAPLIERLKSSGITSYSISNVTENLNRWQLPTNNLYFVEGWFQETLPTLAKDGGIKKIALLRLDGDLYESTIVCLEYLFPLLSEGGVCIVDDFALPGARKALFDYLTSVNYTCKIKEVEGGGGVVYFIK